MFIEKKILFVTGLPRAASTLLCQLLDMHPEIESDGHSSPLHQMLSQLRHNYSDNNFLLSQLDCDFERGYQRLLDSSRGFINGWFAQSEKPWVVDKNRGWLGQIDMVNLLDPNFRMLVCVREPAQIYGSIEAQHQKTLLLDFPDHTGNLSRHARADTLFANDGVIGSPLKSIESLQDIPQILQERLFYVVFEHLMQEPQKVMAEIYQWLGVSKSHLDTQNLAVKAHESDSYYRFKYLHKTRSTLSPPRRHAIPPRIENAIQQQYADFYRLFYSGIKLKGKK
jgi:sulfotransferase